MGGPRNLTEIEPFLVSLLGDPAMVRLPFFIKPWQGRLAARWARKRTPKVTARYRQIGGGSPLISHTDQLAEDLQTRLRDKGLEAMGKATYRYSRPGVDQALEEMEREGVRRLTQLSLYPHFSHTTTGSSLAATDTLLNGDRAGWQVTTIDSWGEENGYLDLLEEQVREALARGGGTSSDTNIHDDERPNTALLCSAHGLPRRYVENGDPYLDQVTATFRALSRRLDPLECRLGFQSQMGPVKWLEPTSSQMVAQLAEEGYSRLLVLPLGFVCDHIETLYDMDILLFEQALEAGFESFRRLPAFNDQETFVEFLAELIIGKLETTPTTRNEDDT